MKALSLKALFAKTCPLFFQEFRKIQKIPNTASVMKYIFNKIVDIARIRLYYLRYTTYALL